MNVLETDSSFSDFYRYGFGWDALYFLDREGLQPYLVGGLGLAHNEILDVVGGDETNGYVNLGVGFLTQPFNNEYGIALRGDVRLVHDGGVSETDLVAGLGLQMSLSRPAAAAPEPVAVGDSDGDGVPDNLDKCPGTMPGLKVDETGCAVPQVFVLKGVSFDFDSTRLGVNAQTILEDAVKTMLGQPSMKVEIAGHTDNYGSDEYNQSLSQRRADAVREYLISKGVNADSLRATGYGESQPVASNDNDFGREQNRRVEFRIESQ
jgi:OmpA-OmpF porin, OOP family